MNFTVDCWTRKVRVYPAQLSRCSLCHSHNLLSLCVCLYESRARACEVCAYYKALLISFLFLVRCVWKLKACVEYRNHVTSRMFHAKYNSVCYQNSIAVTPRISPSIRSVHRLVSLPLSPSPSLSLFRPLEVSFHVCSILNKY